MGTKKEFSNKKKNQILQMKLLWKEDTSVQAILDFQEMPILSDNLDLLPSNYDGVILRPMIFENFYVIFNFWGHIFMYFLKEINNIHFYLFNIQAKFSKIPFFLFILSIFLHVFSQRLSLDQTRLPLLYIRRLL